MSSTAPILIDVLSSDSFAAEHLPGAVNFCVYETAFIEKMKAAYTDRQTPITVYGLSELTKEAETALVRLQEAGYAQVNTLPGGLDGWKARGGTVEGNGEAASQSSASHEIDVAASSISWTGSNLFNFHTGSLQLASGRVHFSHGVLQAGSFVVDMTSLRCADLTDKGLNAMLIAHLRSDDFFSVDAFPTAEFVIVSVEKLDVTPGLPNYRITGDFTLRGTTNPLEIVATVSERPDGGYVAQSFFDLDRTLWGSLYGSGKFFSRLGQHVVNDQIHFHLKLVTKG
ncbi:MAG: YceI family protein [Chthoniobacteraceae bacterium]